MRFKIILTCPVTMTKLCIKVISMKDDEIRRLRLEKRFSLDYPDFHLVEALDYRNVLPDMLSPEEKRSGLTPAEVGCTKSHILAMKSFLDSDNTHCLILEDDVLGTPLSIRSVKSIADNPENEHIFLFCGGLEGMRNRRFVYGKYDETRKCSKVSIFSVQFLYRTCSYLISRSAAEHILARQFEHFSRADDWSFLLRGYANVFYNGDFSHPEDLSNSHIENQRKKLKKSFFKQVFSDGILRTLNKNLSKAVLLCFGKLLGLKRLVNF